MSGGCESSQVWYTSPPVSVCFVSILHDWPDSVTGGDGFTVPLKVQAQCQWMCPHLWLWEFNWKKTSKAREALFLSRAIFVQIWRPGEAKHLVLSLSVCTVYELECLTDLEPSPPSPLPQFLLVLSVGVSWGTKKEKGLGHFQNDFHCCISAFGRMQLGACQEKKEINDPRARARSGPIEVWSEEERGCLLPRPSRANWRIWSSGEQHDVVKEKSPSKWERLLEFRRRPSPVTVELWVAGHEISTEERRKKIKAPKCRYSAELKEATSMCVRDGENRS